MSKLKRVKPFPGMVITESVQFEAGEYDFFENKGIVIDADGIILDGGGAILRGGHTKSSADPASYRGKADNARELGFFGTGVHIAGRRDVTIKNLSLIGFDLGLHAADCESLHVERCDFTGCFTDPAWGWDDHGFHGAILLERIVSSRICGNRAQGVWDALNMRFSDGNEVCGNNFSCTSDTGLKLWRSCGNTIENNDFSYGIRIDPGEVHARDSACVLIESGSNNNTFRSNDMTHGGDGLFIRVLNGWMSTGNVFISNDCSYANNNAIEAWSDGNTYIGNKANYSSYGFWLGGSDNTVLRGNEAAWNGGLFHNAPEAFGNAGIAVVNGSGSHVVLEDNDIHDNCGPGVAISFREDYPSFHWVIQGNRIRDNRDRGCYKGHGIYIKNAAFLTFGQNRFSGNEGEEVFTEHEESGLTFLKGDAIEAPIIALDIPGSVCAGEEVTFRAISDAANIRWDLGDGTEETDKTVTHCYDKPGFYRTAVTVDNGSRAALAFRNLYVLPSSNTFASDAAMWTVSGGSEGYAVEQDCKFTLTEGSVRFSAKLGRSHRASCPAKGNLCLALGQNRVLYFWMKYVTDADTDWERTERKPVITLYASEDDALRYEPQAGMMETVFVECNEYKDGWRPVSIDLDGPSGWTMSCLGQGLHSGVLNRIVIEYGNLNPGVSFLWLDGFCFAHRLPAEPPR